MAEPITVLICSLLAPMASATFAHSAATRAAAEATTASLLVVLEGASCFEFSAAAIAAKAAATPATDIAACTSALCNLWSSFRLCLISLSHFFIETCLNGDDNALMIVVRIARGTIDIHKAKVEKNLSGSLNNSMYQWRVGSWSGGGYFDAVVGGDKE
ncbi:hypothetical protein RJ639_035546 [Escallonia herrerae]|uniref:Uncharacterized protein n=1 Tax=Escallonia herrerae TaxID=1293975 RepID=A0AA89BGM3_9ASTE|nr:hypothetical protein RJ639_035546 [Escallonia herrerae]